MTYLGLDYIFIPLAFQSRVSTSPDATAVTRDLMVTGYSRDGIYSRYALLFPSENVLRKKIFRNDLEIPFSPYDFNDFIVFLAKRI